VIGVGGTWAFACTGVFIEHGECYQRILTSASLVRASDDQAVLYEKLRVVTGIHYLGFFLFI
jgi:anthranilate/para-aminobenzoate synthase component I